MFAPTFTADQIRRAEQPLLAAQEADDELMQSAAHAVAEAAGAMLDDAALPDDAARVLVLAGPGGNGGDGLYAGAELLLAGRRADAFLPAGKTHERALRAFEAAGGVVLDALPEPAAGQGYALVIDALTGIGGSGALRGGLRTAAEWANASRAAVLAVDVPSGVDADTGAAGEMHVEADTTVTFGGWRRAHALSPACGAQLLADVGLPTRRLHETLGDELAEWAADGPPLLLANRAVYPERAWPAGLQTLPQAPCFDIEPGPRDDKYTGGVVGIRAGSGGYPGAAVLCTAGAVNATPAMVRYAGPQADEVVRAHPEVVATQTLDEAGRVQAWVFGPGAGTDDAAAGELRWILGQEVPVLIDADGLTLLTEHPDLRELAAQRQHATVLTPHDGEFARLREAAGVGESDRAGETLALASRLSCTVVRKGRVTVIAHESDPHTAYAVDAGHSWAATPGSGDVLAGVAGAHLALMEAKSLGEEAALAGAVAVHAVAAKLAAATPYGDAAAPAGRIAAFIRPATALVSHA